MKPGAGLRLIVTRPAAQAAAWVKTLTALGVDAQALPLIAIKPPADPAPVHAAWSSLARHALVMFVSANAVEQFFALRPPGASWPLHTLAGSTGPGTSTALRAAGVPASTLAQPAEGNRAESESLWSVLQGMDWRGKQALIVRGEEGRNWLADRLRGAGAEVNFVVAYRREVPDPGESGHALLQAAQQHPAGHVWLFSSSEAVGHLAGLMPASGTSDWSWQAASALATHPRIAQAAQEAGFGRVALVDPTPEAVAATLATLESAAS